jgi:hypothetical protein
MLLNAIFTVTLLSAVALAFVSAGIAMTQAAIHRAALTYVTQGYQYATAALQQTLQADMQSGGIPSPLPSMTPLPRQCAGANGACTFLISASASFTQLAAPSPAASCDPAASNCAQNTQQNAYVHESRLAARITVTVATSAGVPLATRSSDEIVRTFDTPPYVTLASARDATSDAFAAAGDDGGIQSATPSACASTVPGVTADTSVRVAYRNVQTNACTDGSAWRESSYSVDSGSSPGWAP